jgi:hypothetical protein
MLNSQPKSSSDKLAAELQRLSQRKVTGTLFISADNHRTAQVSLLNGHIIALSCLNKRGIEALLLIREINPNWFQFIQGTSVTADVNLPPAADILNAFISDYDSFGESFELIKNTQKTDAVLRETLAEFMGPVAPLICSKILQRARSLDQAINLLAQEIPDLQQAVDFKERVNQKILLLDPQTKSVPVSPSLGSTNNAVVEIIPQKTRTILQEKLAEFMGPVAPLICKKILRQARSLNQAIDLLAQEIPDQQQALDFKNQVKKKLL